MMNRILLACDLDNTIIHSHRHRREGDVCVEMLEGREQSFMSPRALAAMAAARAGLQLVPVTTRSIAQYVRIAWPEPCLPRCAVTTNGAVLLEDGREDAQWQRQARALVEPWEARMDEAQARLMETGCFDFCRRVDGAYLFARCREEQDPAEAVLRCTGMEPLVCGVTGRKIYFFPPGLDKGSAVRRLRQRLNAPLLVCAGDSPIDAPMLNAADVAIVPADYDLQLLRCGDIRVCPEEDFAAYVLETALGLA